MKIKIVAVILITFIIPNFGLAKTNVISKAKSFLGVKYKYGGTTRKGIDCSAFVKTVYNEKKLPRTSR